MKIICRYCGVSYNDTLESCPSCGGPNPSVRRSKSGKPITIDQLKQWYTDRNLPPYEVTRFFIGQDVREPRAFGIYKDSFSGNFIVYKNKDNGQRAVRYEGTDEAYAVNELLERLKQEIIYQKRADDSGFKEVAGVVGGLGLLGGMGLRGSRTMRRKRGIPLRGGFLVLFIAVAIFMVSLFGISVFLMNAEPKVGYYSYRDTVYYHNSKKYVNSSWFSITEGDEDWVYLPSDRSTPLVLWNRFDARSCYLGKQWKDTMPCPDFKQSAHIKDMEIGPDTKGGYYLLDGDYYYHFDGYCFSDWYLYENAGWRELEAREIPYELRHSSLNSQYFESETCELGFPVTDFSQTVEYDDHFVSNLIGIGYYKVDDTFYYHHRSYYDTGWYVYDEENGWSAVNVRPEELNHPSTAQDFYYTPTWDESAQFTNFEDTEFYTSDSQDTWSSTDDSSSYNWDSGSSWNSSSTDWGSDW